ncbi:PilL N-terminal domain-containing protein [Allopusillimonas ginsengisoli]|uniref:PFGI-1 class ICE element type IV pilus protein PilL2 n=1 Tax=Allopusillimonas ginsengisoli TaxID=453575 RepID=UPI0039C19862
MRLFNRFNCRLAVPGLLGASVLASGCVATTTLPSAPPAEETVSAPAENTAFEMIPVVRYGRYTLVELAPLAAQRDLLLQIVDVTVPENARASVGDGLRHVLKRSGYRLSPTTAATSEFYALPLPTAHLRLGPMTLRDALLTLTGSDWALQIDDMAREVRFVRPNSNDTALTPADDIPASEPAQAFPIAAAGSRS